MTNTFQDSAQSESSENLTNTTDEVDGCCADNRRREGTAAQRLWPEVSTAEWKGIPALAAREGQWLKPAPVQLRVRSVSSPDEKEGGHGHQWHKQIKRSNSSRETCPPWANRGRSHSSPAAQQSCLCALDLHKNHWSPVEKVIAWWYSTNYLQSVPSVLINWENNLIFRLQRQKRSKHSQHNNVLIHK